MPNFRLHSRPLVKSLPIATVVILALQTPLFAQQLGAITAEPTQPASAFRPGVNDTLTVGPVCIPNASIKVNETTLEVGQHGYQVSSGPLLRAVVVRYDETGTGFGGTRKATGLALFNGGTLLAQLTDSAAATTDSIFRPSGAIEGTIVGADAAAVLVRKKDGALTRISFTDVTYIRSPRAFVFTLTGAPVKQTGTSVPAVRTRVQSVSFQPTTANTGISLSSVVPHKDPLTDDLADSEDDISSLFAKTGAPKTINSDGSVTPTFGPSARPFPNWP